MEIKPTLFSLSGFFAPGFVLIFCVSGLLFGQRYATPADAIRALPPLPSDSGWAFLIGTGLVAVTLVASFVLGTILSEAFIFVGRKLILRPIMRETHRKQVDRLFKHETLKALIKADMDAREALVYMKTSGLDLHWYAGRIRMMGGTGLALLIAAVLSWALCYTWPTIAALVLPSLFAFCAALLRSYKFDEYIAAASAVIAHAGTMIEQRAEE